MYMNDLGQITPEDYPPKDQLLPGAHYPVEARMVPLEHSPRRQEREQVRRFTPEPIPSENVMLRDKRAQKLEIPREEEGTLEADTELQNPSGRKHSAAEIDWELAEEGGSRTNIENEQKRILEGLSGKGIRRMLPAAAAIAPLLGKIGGKGIRRMLPAAAAIAPLLGKIEMGMAADMNPEDVQRALEQDLGMSLSDEEDAEGRAEASGKSRMKAMEEDDKDFPPDDEVPPPPVSQAPSRDVPAIPVQPGWRLMHNKVWGRVICREEAAEGRKHVEYVIVSPEGRKIEKVKFNAVNCRIELRKGYTVEEVGKAIIPAPPPEPEGTRATPRIRLQPEGKKKAPLPPSLVDDIEFGESTDMDPEKLEKTLEQGLGMDLADDEKDENEKGEEPPGVHGCGCNKDKPTPADAVRLMELGLGDEVDNETREQIEDTFFGIDE
jgi:hypothetical protein